MGQDVKRHVKKGKMCAGKDVGPSVPHYNLGVWCQSRHVRAKLLSCQWGESAVS